MYDAIVVGTGAGGGTAIKVLCEAGLSVLASIQGPAPIQRRTIAIIVRCTT